MRFVLFGLLYAYRIYENRLINVHEPAQEKYGCGHEAFALEIVNLIIVQDRYPKQINFEKQKHVKVVPDQLNVDIQELLVVVLILNYIFRPLKLFDYQNQYWYNEHVAKQWDTGKA